MSKPALKNDVFIRSLLRQSVPYTPVWMMRQAGRYLPEYNATRAEAGSFLNLAKSPELATEVTLQPLRRFPLDAAILFSDILTIPDAMGLGLRFETGEGPKFDRPLRSEEDIRQLPSADLNELRYVFDAVTMIRHELDGQVPLIGFSGSPWTLACYMVEGGGSSDYRQIKTLMYQRPDLMHHILAINAKSVAEYLNEQVKAGAQALMIFDSWGGVLADGLYQKFSLFYMKEVISRLIRDVDGTPIPVIIFTKGGGMWLEDMLDSGCDAIGVDWTVNLGRARSRLCDKVALQGNLDPMTLFGTKQSIEDEVKRTLDSVGVIKEGAGHVFNLGHGISQFTNPDSAAVLVETVHSYSRQYHI